MELMVVAIASSLQEDSLTKFERLAATWH